MDYLGTVHWEGGEGNGQAAYGDNFPHGLMQNVLLHYYGTTMALLWRLTRWPHYARAAGWQRAPEASIIENSAFVKRPKSGDYPQLCMSGRKRMMGGEGPRCGGDEDGTDAG